MSDIGLGPGFAIAFVGVLAVAFVLWIAIGGLMMRLAARWAAGLKVGYGRACAVVALSGVAGLALSGLLAWATGAFGYASGLDVGALLLVRAGLGLLVPVAMTALVAWALLPGGGARLTGPQALGVAAIYCGAMLALYLALVLVPMLLLGGVPGVSR